MLLDRQPKNPGYIIKLTMNEDVLKRLIHNGIRFKPMVENFVENGQSKSIPVIYIDGGETNSVKKQVKEFIKGTCISFDIENFYHIDEKRNVSIEFLNGDQENLGKLLNVAWFQEIPESNFYCPTYDHYFGIRR